MRTTIGLLLLTACAGGDADSGTDTGTTPVPVVPATYDFEGRAGGDSSVSYEGQAFRHLLISDLDAWIVGLTARLDGGAWFPVAGEVEAGLAFYFVFDSDTSGGLPHGFVSDPAPLQVTYDDLSSDKDLVGKLAGNDPGGQHQDWAVDGIGWDAPGVGTPESLVWTWFAELDAAAVARANGVIPLGPDGAPVPSVALTADGRDLRQLIQKFLVGGIAYSQGADDYLDDDLPGSGLLSSNVAAAGAEYTDLEHAWDEGFGYFGAPRDFGAWTDERTADPGAADTWNPDGAIDLSAEVAWGHSANAAKRDLGAVAATDLTQEAWSGFLEGRALLASIDGELDADQLDTLRAHRDRALGAWEGAIVATVVHYANDVLRDMSAFDTPDYVYADHAKHWSELKGFALVLQFNPRSCASETELAEIHDRLGTRPVLPGAGAAAIDDYRQGLNQVKQVLAAACDVDPANLGDEDGVGGW